MKPLFAALMMLNPVAAPDEPVDTLFNLQQVEVVAPLKQQGPLFDQPVSGMSFSLGRLEKERIEAPKDLSLAVSNLYIPDYGSKMTSTIYVRGLGARMEQPSMGLYIDHVPVLNKNNYDFDFYDIRQADVLRGPQGTLYGRNTIGGVMNIYTLSPFDFQGARVSLGYGNGNTWEAKASVYHKPSERLAFSVAAAHHSSDGFFTNEFDGSKADKILTEGLRGRVIWRRNRLSIDNTLSLNLVKQNGFPYAFVDVKTGIRGPIDHNDPCTYDRFGLINGTTVQYTTDKFILTGVTSYQFMDDKMVMDQDFLPRSMFSLKQAQTEHAVTEEILIRSRPGQVWQWLFGGFGFYRHLTMDAPVTFKRDGIDELILANANKGIQSMFPDQQILIREDRFVIGSDFTLPAYGLAAFHQSTLTLGRWNFTAGVRLDYEYTSMKYANDAELNFRFTMTMPEFRPLRTQMSGKENKSFLEVLPRFSLSHRLNDGNIYATVSRGYKAGGFNTQIFSDILQNRMMDDMMRALGMTIDSNGPNYDIASATSYEPEYSWNYEIGTHLDLIKNRLSIEGAIFYIDAKNQQITVFPPGESTGRLMSNAGQTRSYGAEAAINYTARNFRLDASYGYTNARFVEYVDGDDDFKNNYVPYVPQNTVYVRGEYGFDIPSRWLERISLNVNWRGAGKMYWNEENNLSQPFYGLLGAGIDLRIKSYHLSLWGKNLTGKSFDTFYFKSIGNHFLQKGKPFQFGATLNLTL